MTDPRKLIQYVLTSSHDSLLRRLNLKGPVPGPMTLPSVQNLSTSCRRVEYGKRR
jgi:hypothetical protein